MFYNHEKSRLNVEQLLTTKLYIPPPCPDIVRRPRLIERLNAGLHGKLTLISAPAGFGKTTLMSEWVNKTERPVAWVSLDEGDNDVVRFLAYFVSALQKIRASIGETSPADEERDALIIQILDLATSLAHRERCDLLIIHAWSFAVESHVQSGRISVSPRLLDEWIENSRLNHKRKLGELLQLYDLENLKHQVYMLKGKAGRLIPALAAAKEVSLIVMGTVCRTGVAGLLIGNTAEKVLHQVDCSVLTVKPEGFITPVNLDA